MSNTKEVHSKPRLHVSLSTCYLEYGRHVARLHCRCCRRRRAYAPMSNTASHDNHEKINLWVSFCFPYMGCLWGSAKLAWDNYAPLQMISEYFPAPGRCLNCVKSWVFCGIQPYQKRVAILKLNADTGKECCNPWCNAVKPTVGFNGQTITIKQ